MVTANCRKRSARRPAKRWAVVVDAVGWQVTGIRPNGVPENQVFFSRQREVTEEEAAYDRKDFNIIVAVDRTIEVGLTWQVRNEVTRLSSQGKAVSLRVPLLAGEQVLTPGLVVEDGAVEVKMGAGDQSFAWESELPIGGEISLEAQSTDRWVERWRLVTSPVWNSALAGLSPVFEASQKELVPVWHPWPGEAVTLSFSKPEAVSGETVTVRHVRHEVSLGSRRRTAKLDLNVECSLGAEFVVKLDPEAEIASLKLDNLAIPVRRDGGGVIIPVRPGRQTIELEWRNREPMAVFVDVGVVALPVEAANITTVVRVPESRWVLWAHGPLRGPAVRFWTIVIGSVLVAWVLGSLKLSPISRLSWMLLAVGLTQVYVVPSLLVIGWFFLLAWRGKEGRGRLSRWRFNVLQLALGLLSAASLLVLMVVVGEGLLGNPEMFIRGNGSGRTSLQWFQPAVGLELPRPVVISISVWFYRLLMLAWALWLATALIRWLKWGWAQFSSEGCWKRRSKQAKPPPPVPEIAS